MFSMLISSYCCCLILSGYFYTSKQNSDIGHSPGPKNNRPCSHPYAFCLPQAGLPTFQLPVGNDGCPVLNTTKLCQGLPRRLLACPEPKRRQGIEQNALTEFQFLCPVLWR